MRSRERITPLLLAGLTLGSSIARAQELNLEPLEPAPGASVVHSSVADALKETAAKLRMTSEDKDYSPEAAVRELAGALLERGLRRAGDGAELLISGHTIALNLDRLDEGLKALPGVDRATLAADCRRLASTLASDPDAVDRSLRDVLAPLTDAQRLDPDAGWIGLRDPAPDSASLTARVDRPPISNAPGLLRLIDEARTDPAYRPAADRLARRLDAAALCLDLPDSVNDDARAALADHFAEAVRQCLGGNAIEGGELLDAIALTAALLVAIEQLPADADLELARAHTESMVVQSGPIPVDRVRLALRLAAAATAPEPSPLAASFVRELRPPWTELRADAKSTKATLRPLIGASLSTSMDTDPGVLAALNAAKKVDTRLRDLDALNALLKGELGPDSPPVAHRDHRLLAERAGRLWRESPASFWNLADQARRFASLPGEPVWRDPATLRDGYIASIDALLPEIVAATDRLRTQWEDEWSNGTSGSAAGDAGTELNAGIRLLSILDAISTAQRADETGWRLAAWTGWEHPVGLKLSPVLVGDTPALAVLVAAWTDPLTPVDEVQLAEAEQRFAAVRAMARLERTLESAGRSPTAPSLGGAITQLGLGSPDPQVDPLVADRSLIAELNRRVLEAAALASDEKVKAQALDYANDAGVRLLNKLGNSPD